MKSLGSDPLQDSLTLHDTKVAMLGYDAEAREHALALRNAGNTVAIGVRPDTLCWSRAIADGFAVDRASAVVAGAEVVVVLAGDHEPTWRQCEPHVADGALVVFGCARALEAGACTRGGVDVVLVTRVDGVHGGCRVAVHRDVTGRALLRAVGYAHAAVDPVAAVRATSVAAEADLELASIGERAGSLLALAASGERMPPLAADPPEAAAEAEADARSWFAAMLEWRSRQ